MRKRTKINVDEILADSAVDGYRPDGFRILARMIARRYMGDMSRGQSIKDADTSRPNEINGSGSESEYNRNRIK